uniref:Uncharacterized protein n=1 Tax=Escherichia coli TaxID=562 RepID=A0A223LKD7_ECOLX|nr:Hypothetical protein [Escherichia coli]
MPHKKHNRNRKGKTQRNDYFYRTGGIKKPLTDKGNIQADDYSRRDAGYSGNE